MRAAGDAIAAESGKPTLLLRLRQSFSAQAIHFATPFAMLFALQLSQFWLPSQVKGNPLEFLIGVMLFSLPLGFLGLLIVQFYHVAFTDKSQRPTKDLFRRMKAVLGNPRHMVAGVPLYIILVVFMYAFTMSKAEVGHALPYAWDATFDAWDAALHFGYRPWELLQPVFGNLPATLLLNVNYNIWFMIMQVFLVSFAFLQAPNLQRTHFYLSFMAVWALVGGAMAVIFSSAGPCYFGNLGFSENPYAPLMAQLRGFNDIIPIWAVDTQDWLWKTHAEKLSMGGVSAMPSVHNATATLFVLAAWNGRKLWRNVLLAHAVLIFLGSVHLGWHYAVDAYVAVPVALFVWWVMKPIAIWWENLPHVQAFNREYADV